LLVSSSPGVGSTIGADWPRVGHMFNLSPFSQRH
jgi:hypothetical protein